MYLPKHFAETDVAALHALMRARPLATLVTHGPADLNANHIPLSLVADEATPYGMLHGHIARANPLAEEIAAGCPGLAIFHGPEAYISPNWYATKAETGRAVPTWNYTAVHAAGELRCIDDPEWILGQLNALTAEHEATQPQPWSVSDAPADYIEKMLGAIVGIEFRITRLTGKWKTSQNQPPANQASLIAALDGQPMADLIRGRMGK
jgi:transcriptional regulator